MGYGSGSAASGVLEAMRLFCGSLPTREDAPRNAQEKFHRYGLPVLCVAKFVPGLDAVMPPLAGAEGVSLAAFLALDAIGALLWSVCYVGLGYVFSNQLELSIRWVQHFGTALGIAIAVPIVLYAGWRGLALVRMILDYGCGASVRRCSRADSNPIGGWRCSIVVNFEWEESLVKAWRPSRLFRCGPLCVAEGHADRCSR